MAGIALNETLGMWIAAVLTIMVYSYLLGDNPLYRVAEHLFVGSSVAYAVVVAVHSVLAPRLLVPLVSGSTQERLLLLVPLVLGLLLLAKVRGSWSWLGNLSMAFLFGTGAGLALGGALFGSLVPQIEASMLPLLGNKLVDHLIIIVGTIATLGYFYFNVGSQRGLGRLQAAWVRLWARLGRWMILITFGAIFANTAMARISLLIGRVQFLLRFLLDVALGR